MKQALKGDGWLGKVSSERFICRHEVLPRVVDWRIDLAV